MSEARSRQAPRSEPSGEPACSFEIHDQPDWRSYAVYPPSWNTDGSEGTTGKLYTLSANTAVSDGNSYEICRQCECFPWRSASAVYPGSSIHSGARITVRPCSTQQPEVDRRYC